MLVLGIFKDLGKVELANETFLFKRRVAEGLQHLLTKLDRVSQLTHHGDLLRLARALVRFPHFFEV